MAPKRNCADCGRGPLSDSRSVRCHSCACILRDSGRARMSVVVSDRHKEKVDRVRWYLRNGYVRGWPFGKKCESWALHRYVWFLEHGSAPELIDHINRNKLDNRIENLRPANKALNARNVKRHSSRDLPTGVKSFKHRELKKPFQAVIRRHGRERSLGYFDNIADASAAYEDARQILDEFDCLCAS